MYDKQEIPNANERLYDKLKDTKIKEHEEQAELIPVKFRDLITKGWVIKYFNDEVNMPLELEELAREVTASWENKKDEDALYFPWSKSEIAPHLRMKGNATGGAW